MRIAIIGAGFCGLAAAWHLLQCPEIKVVVFDRAEIGGGTSGMAAGLLHPFAGLHSKLNWGAREGMTATGKLLEIASKALGRPIAEQTGLFRLAVADEQKKDFSACASLYPTEVDWLEAIELPGVISHPGIFVKSALTVNCELYLKGLWKACQSLGASFEKKAVENLAELADFDAIVCTAGAAIQTITELAHLPITAVKGQILEFQWPEKLPLLPCPLNSNAYLISDPYKKTCLVGSTFERHFKHEEPDTKAALFELSPKLISFFPSLVQTPPVNCKAGVRASTPNHLPILKKISNKCWVLVGMGSKGLLYHAMMAEKLSALMLSETFMH